VEMDRDTLKEENEKLKKENEKLKDKLWDVEETIRVAIASRLAYWFPDEKMGDNEYAEDCDVANNLNGDDLVKMIDGFRDDILQTHKRDIKENEKLKKENEELKL
jgi:cell division protein FtsB